LWNASAPLITARSDIPKTPSQVTRGSRRTEQGRDATVDTEPAHEAMGSGLSNNGTASGDTWASRDPLKMSFV
jgi:hypothetical protein